MRGEGDRGGPTVAWPAAPATSGPADGRTPASATLGVQALADSLDRASLNMGIAALDGVRSATAKTGPAAAADSAKRLADQMVEQMNGLGAVLAELNPVRR